MKLAYFGCFAGVSGDMILGALVDAGVALGDLKIELNKLKLDGFDLTAKKVVKNGITGTHVEVITEESHVHRHLKEIEEIINQSDLAPDLKDESKRVFQTLAKAEAKVHNTTPDKIHFHEVGALDAIVDIVGSVIGLSLLGTDMVVASRIHVGTGFVECQHGKIPVPAPATIEILKGTPLFSTGIEAELTTPTGAAILKTLAKGFGPMPAMTVDCTGYGAGSRDLEIPNLLRLICGRQTSSSAPFETDQVTLVECNIDDMNPEILGYVTERVMEHGALDVWLTPINMKKNRIGAKLSVLASVADADSLVDIVFAETTTLGVRMQPMERRKLAREVRIVHTRYGDIKTKVSLMNGKVRHATPEYEDCKAAAQREGVPLMEVYEEVRRVAQEQIL